ncbi:MAG: glycoside hydrolase family 16 protein, partial [Roseburia sp.]|nr:glycoside hydrolase family 16 protein [Roseburia sp.]
MKKHLLWKRVAACALAAAMVITAPASWGGNWLPELVKADTAGTATSQVLNLENLTADEKEFFVGGENGWGNSAATLTAEGTKATIGVTSFGNQGQEWELQYKIKNAPVENDKKYRIEFDITSTVDKAVFFKVEREADQQGLGEKKMVLEAGEKFHYSEQIEATTYVVKNFIFAMGNFEGETADPGTITIENITITEVTAETAPSQVLNLENLTADEKEFFVGGENGWGNSAATLTAEGTKATIGVTSFGNQGQEWELQYKIKNAPVENDKKYRIEFDITSTVDKAVFFKVEREADQQGLGEKKMVLEAGEKFHYSEQIEATTYVVKNFIFAMGNFEGETADPGTITIENITITDITGEVAPDPKGPEYNFKADNSANDTADPGKTKTGYDLIWADEFDGNYGAGANVDAATGLNLDYWEAEPGDGSIHNNAGWGNKELQSYTGLPKNVKVNEDLNEDGNGDGMLRITACYEPEGYAYGTESSKKYTSARLRTTSEAESKIDTTYGYIEARMSLPQTKGAWPAFWMLPESTDIYGSWPVSGEIDIMETTGINTDSACGTLHWGAPEHVYRGSGYVTLNKEIQYFHTYAVDWEPGKITWYYDGTPIKTMSTWKGAFSNASDSLAFDAPFDQPFYILLNLAVDSGQFGGADNKATFQDDINMYVDYVRLYQKTGGYPDYAERENGDASGADWEKYAGQNQIAEITDTALVSVDGGNVNALESGSKLTEGKWYLGYQDAAVTLEPATIGGKTWAKLAVTSAGANDYSAQLIGHYDAKEGYAYKVSFDAYADGGMVGKRVNCDSKEWSGWTTYGIQGFTLSDTSEHTEFIFEQPDDFEDCRIEFNLGAVGTGNVYISNVKVEIIDPSLTGVEKTRKPLSNGDVIFNGTFDQGSHYTGYWTAETGTTLTVPRYTTEKIAESDVKVYDYASTKNSFEHIADGIKYYERRAQISAASGEATIYQREIPMKADSYTLKMDMYSAASTTVTASILNDNGTVAATKTFSYSAADKVKELTWNFTTATDISSASLKLSFGAGAVVQIDNVSMLGESQGEYVDPHPMNQETTWAFDGTGALATENGVLTATGLTSGDAWYAPQIISSNYLLVAGKTYTLKFKAKLEGDTNNSFEYIIQENSGSWHVYGGDAPNPSKLLYDSTKADADGFCTYEIEFTADMSLNTVHTVFGLGNSEANNATLILKDVAMDLKQENSGEPVTPGTPSASSTPATVTTTEVKPDGTTVVTTTTTNADGSRTETVTATATDGSKTETKT